MIIVLPVSSCFRYSPLRVLSFPSHLGAVISDVNYEASFSQLASQSCNDITAERFVLVDDLFIYGLHYDSVTFSGSFMYNMAIATISLSEEKVLSSHRRNCW